MYGMLRQRVLSAARERGGGAGFTGASRTCGVAGSKGLEPIAHGVEMKHIAGPWICLNKNLLIQRCVACGHALIREEVSRMAVPTEDDRGISTFAVGDINEPLLLAAVSNLSIRLLIAPTQE